MVPRVGGCTFQDGMDRLVPTRETVICVGWATIRSDRAWYPFTFFKFLVRKVIVFSASNKSALALVRAIVSQAFVVASVKTAAQSWAVVVAKLAMASTVS